jgi:AcrR family transcriptional regulator
MGRPKGSHNEGYEVRRAELARAVVPLLMAGDAAPSMRALAEAAGVSVPTMRHWFGDARGVIAAAVVEIGKQGVPHNARGASAELGPVDASVRWFVGELVTAWRQYGVGQAFAVGLEAGLHDGEVGPAFVDSVLEPLLQTVEARLQVHLDRGELRPVPARTLALALLSPVVLALLHQGPLRGEQCRPLDVDALVDAHIAGFLRGYATEPAAASA